jgi:predicted DNA-binding protein with PD1-like motif
MLVTAVRLHPGEDLRQSLLRFASDQSIEAACVLSGLGSLKQVTLRHAGRSQVSTLAGDFEILTVSGTLSKHGIHLHSTVSDGHGKVTGGHLCDGCVIRTTGEIVLGIIDSLSFLREFDAQTGFAELVIRKKGLASNDERA